MQTTVTIVGVIIGYLAKSLAENLSKHGVFTKNKEQDIKETGNQLIEKIDTSIKKEKDEEIAG